MLMRSGGTTGESTSFLQRHRGGACPRPAAPRDGGGELPKAKITRVRIYRPPNLNLLFNQSNMVVTVETNIGITGIGEAAPRTRWNSARGR
jgi:galactonate dehydratase